MHDAHKHGKLGVPAVELVHQHPSISTPTAGFGEARFQGNVVELLPLRLHYKVPWPLSMIVDDAVLLKYNQVLIFLLQVCVKTSPWFFCPIPSAACGPGANQWLVLVKCVTRVMFCLFLLL